MKNFYLSILAGILFISQTASTQDWTKLSLPETGKHITSMMEGANGTLYAATPQGLFSSTDGASTWELVNRGLKNIALNVTEDGRPLCLNTTQILTVDENNTLELYEDLGFFIVQFTPNMVVANNGSIHLTYGESLQMKYFISTDDGQTFTQQTYNEPPLFEGFRKTPFFKNHTSGDLFYLADNYTLQRSTDNGATYNTVGSELDIFSVDQEPFSLDPVTGNIYCLINEGNQPIVHKSTDNGETWNAVSTGGTYGLSIAVHDGEIVIWGASDIFHSVDDGANWNNVSSIFGNQAKPDAFFIGSDGTFYGYNNNTNNELKNSDAIVSVDFQTETITRKTTGLDYTYAEGLSSNGSRICASLSKWAHYSDDDGETWTPLTGEGAKSKRTYVANDGTVYTSAWQSGVSGAVHVQNDQDSTVQVLDTEGEEIYQLKFMFEDDSENMYLMSFDKFYRSSIGGPFTLIPDVPIDALNHREIWFSSELQRIFSILGNGTSYYSDDQGDTWTESQPIGGIAQTTFSGANEVWGFNLSTSFAEQGYYTTTDLQNWSQQCSTTNNLTQGAFGLDATTIIAATETDIQLSEDAGLTWEIIIDGIELAEIYDWQGLAETIEITQLEKTPSKMMLSANGGMYLREYEDGPTLVEEALLRDKINLYPNPAHLGQVVVVELEEIPSSIVVYDMLGKAIISERSTKQINTSSLKKGTYIIRVELKDKQLQNRLLID